MIKAVGVFHNGGITALFHISQNIGNDGLHLMIRHRLPGQQGIHLLGKIRLLRI